MDFFDNEFFDTNLYHVFRKDRDSVKTRCSRGGGVLIAVRRCPRQVQSDNGNTFVGASTTLSRDFLQAVKESVTDAYSHQQLTRQFIPPGAPKSFETLFYKTTATRKYIFGELSTLLTKIEACLNSRPLSPMSEDPTDLLALTPGHFFVGGPLLSIVEPKDEYLKELHKRNKWQVPIENQRVGDLVVIKDDNLPSNEWRLGRIDSVFPGADGNVRVVDIRTTRGIVQRLVTKEVLLPREPFKTTS
ncbi:uncharacterized protein [Drosophila suzukii]|uniref:DUF5641 domain-containing protein n=1 Tax=Drosophila suzukii TaxID=28584 RepID=A0ABM4TXB9_DROSZ